jgi:hypothetical protein
MGIGFGLGRGKAHTASKQNNQNTESPKHIIYQKRLSAESSKNGKNAESEWRNYSIGVKPQSK